ncbi:ABC transporter ATP-binding protein [Paenibacillus aceris]|uniref:ABC transport system ATP-binding protein n=1 Tax=Paenibacillus aceris TaxID=869555 RepID=A0ABS4I702_9BACL|nr:ATP-binding cassette domain-containing protein [Paenibacillus aceris]MBP1966630.1 putative ABC transport system ATP-binding protein [Paenibacillus aceris]NHW38866.1 ATP-binding cassette domain-containing protein [Paenibacillus aceris]
MQSLLVVKNLTKKHPSGGASHLFKELNMEVRLKDSIAIQGPSGHGKSTLLRVLASLEGDHSDCLALHGRSVSAWGPCEWRKKVCYVPQQPALVPGTIEDNLTLVSKLHHRKFDQKLAAKLIDEVGLGELDWSQDAAALSGGQKQRIQLVRSMLLESDILLLDEVSSALDAQSKLAVEATLKKWREDKGVALIWVTHEQDQAKRVANRFWYLENGVLTSDTIEKDGHLPPQDEAVSTGGEM